MSQTSVFTRRFSCRRFTTAPVDVEALVRMLESARWAPSGGNLQPWRFLVVREPAQRRALAGAAAGQDFIARAPVVIVVCAVPEESGRIYGDRGRRLYCLQDTAAATENLLLAATNEGLGTCWVGAFDEHQVTRALGLASQWRPVAMVPVGHPAEHPERRFRRTLDDVVVWLD